MGGDRFFFVSRRDPPVDGNPAKTEGVAFSTEKNPATGFGSCAEFQVRSSDRDGAALANEILRPANSMVRSTLPMARERSLNNALSWPRSGFNRD
jgi:hypothetical protein